MEYYIGQIFEEMYPSEAADWCNHNNAMIVETAPKGDVRVFEIVAVPEPTQDEQKRTRIAMLKAQLDSTDYKIIKCSEHQLAGLDLPYDVAVLHAERQAIRDEINQLEN